jgi:hypothetical protein
MRAIGHDSHRAVAVAGAKSNWKTARAKPTVTALDLARDGFLGPQTIPHDPDRRLVRPRTSGDLNRARTSGGYARQLSSLTTNLGRSPRAHARVYQKKCREHTRPPSRVVIAREKHVPTARWRATHRASAAGNEYELHTRARARRPRRESLHPRRVTNLRESRIGHRKVLSRDNNRGLHRLSSAPPHPSATNDSTNRPPSVRARGRSGRDPRARSDRRPLASALAIPAHENNVRSPRFLLRRPRRRLQGDQGPSASIDISARASARASRRRRRRVVVGRRSRRWRRSRRYRAIAIAIAARGTTGVRRARG